MTRNYVSFTCLLIILSTLIATGQDWPGFHGQERQGVSHETAAAVDWSGKIETAWKAPIQGFGFSSPVVAGENIYLTTAYVSPRGSGLRAAAASSSLVLAWGLLIITTIISVRAAANDWSGRLILFNGVRLVLLMTVALLVLEMCLFAQGLFSLNYSVVRSWKIGTAVSALSLFMAMLFGPRQIRPLALFAVAATFLSGFAYVLMPKRDTLFDNSTSDVIISLGVVLVPIVVAWAICLTWLLARKTFPQPEESVPQASLRSRLMRTALCCGLPALLTIGIFQWLVWHLLDKSRSVNWNAPDEAELTVLFEPVLGWAVFAVGALLSFVVILIGCRFLFRRPALRRPLVVCGECVSLLLGLSCFLWFAAFPSKRQVAYVVVCLDKKTGATQWMREVGYSATLHDYKGANSHATPTVALGIDGLCAYFGSGGLVGLDLAGKVRWKIQNAEFDSPFGVGHSPVVEQDMVLLANDNESYPAARKTLESHIIAYSLKKGHELWRQKRDRSQPGAAGFSTPIVRTIHGQRTVLMRGWEDLTAYDLHTGRVLWSHRLKHSGNFLVAGMVTDEKHVYVLDAVGVRAFSLDALADGRDTVEWRAQVPGEKISSPVLVNGLLFSATDTGVAFCVDTQNGSLVWKQRLGARFFSSLVAKGDAVIFADEGGNLYAVSCDRTFKLITQKNLGEKIYATPIPQAEGLLVRAATNLYFLESGQAVGTTNRQESASLLE